MRSIKFVIKKLPEADTRIEKIRKFLNENNLQWEERHTNCLDGAEKTAEVKADSNITHLYFKGDLTKKGYVSENGFTLCKGTKVVSEPKTDRTYEKNQILNELKRLKDGNYIDGAFMLKEDVEFSSATLAGKMLSGTSEGNKNNFKTAAGIKFNDLYSKK